VSAVFTRPGAASSLRDRIATTITAVRVPTPHTDTGCARYRLSASRCRAPFDDQRPDVRPTDRSGTRRDNPTLEAGDSHLSVAHFCRLDNSLDKVRSKAAVKTRPKTNRVENPASGN
jgi:hypothetical protein